MRTLYVLGAVFVLFFLGTSLAVALEYSGALRVTHVDHDEVSLSWEPLAEAHSYVVYYDYTQTIDLENPQYFEQSDPIQETQYTVRGLEADTRYSFVIAAVNSDGEESSTTSDSLVIKTLKQQPDFELADVAIVTPEGKKVVVAFTSVIDVDRIDETKLTITNLQNQSEVLVKGYLPSDTDLRELTIFLSESLMNDLVYRVDVQEIYDTHGRTIAQESQTTKEFVASFQEHSASQQEEDLTLDAAADPEPVPIDTLPQTGPREIAFIAVIILILVSSYAFLLFRRT